MPRLPTDEELKKQNEAQQNASKQNTSNYYTPLNTMRPSGTNFAKSYAMDDVMVDPHTGRGYITGSLEPVKREGYTTTTEYIAKQRKKDTVQDSGGGNSGGGVTVDPLADYKAQLGDLYNKVMGYGSYTPGSTYTPTTFTPETFTPAESYTPTTFTPETYTPGSTYTPTTYTAGVYTPSVYHNTVDTSGTQAMLDTALADIRGYDDFKYDLNADLLYNQFVDNYAMLGQQAMQDTMAQAAALTGGYGNSYAAGVGNQAYQQYLTQANNMIPQFQQMAMNVWQSGYDRLLNDYGAISQQLQNLLNIEAMNFDIWNANETNAANAFAMNEANRFNAWNTNEQNAFNAWNANEQLAQDAFNINQNNAFNAWQQNENNAYNSWLSNAQLAQDAFNINESNRFNAWAQNEQNAFNAWQQNEANAFNQWQAGYNQVNDQYELAKDYISTMESMTPKYTSSGSSSSTTTTNKKANTGNKIVDAVLNGNTNLNPNNGIVAGALLSNPATSQVFYDWLQAQQKKK